MALLLRGPFYLIVTQHLNVTMSCHFDILLKALFSPLQHGNTPCQCFGQHLNGPVHFVALQAAQCQQWVANIPLHCCCA